MEYKNEGCASGGGGKISVKDDRSFKAVGNPRQEKNNSIVRISTLFPHYIIAVFTSKLKSFFLVYEHFSSLNARA